MTEEKDLIAFCGLSCKDCFLYKGRIADLVRDLRKELRQSKFDNQAEVMSKEPFFAVLKDYRQCYEVLGALVKFRCKRTCRGGGGPPFCKIRKCCQRRAFEGCWQCDEFETCAKLDSLKPFRGDAQLKNIRKIRKLGIDNFIKGTRYC